jgi:hypothetical protein
VLGSIDGPEVVDGARVSASYFRVFGLNPNRGRVFTAEEDRPGGPEVVVLSDQLWRRIFAADSAIVGKTIVLDGTSSVGDRRHAGVVHHLHAAPNSGHRSGWRRQPTARR